MSLSFTVHQQSRPSTRGCVGSDPFPQLPIHARVNVNVANGGGAGTGGLLGDRYPTSGGAATATANASATSGPSFATATATGGAGNGSGVYLLDGDAGGSATATASATATTGSSTVTATATGGGGGDGGVGSDGGVGGDATATGSASARNGGAAAASATAIAGSGGAPSISGAAGADGAANAVSSAITQRGALAQAQSTAVGSSGGAQSTAQTSLHQLGLVQAVATAPTGSTATTNAIAEAGGSGQAFANPGQTAYAFSAGLPDKTYVTTLVGGASHVTDALLGPRDAVFGAAILGANYAPDGGGQSHTYSAAATFGFDYRGDLLLGLIDNQQNGFDNGLGFQSMEFYVDGNGSDVFDVKFGNLAAAESFFSDTVINLGSYAGPGVDLTFGYNLVADGSGGFGMDFAFGGAVPEPSKWAMMLLGFAGLSYAGYRASRKGGIIR